MIIGSGNIGVATGEWLEANGESVIYNDISSEVIAKLVRQNKKVASNTRTPEVDIFWICTLEWDVEKAIKSLPPLDIQIVVIRSTMKVGDTREIQKKCELKLVAHIPEFLRQSNAIEDSFNPDRVIIGTDSDMVFSILRDLFSSLHNVPVIHVSPNVSELIKLVSNAWLSTQISFWNQIYELSKKLMLNPEEVANAVTLDKRISKYGSNMVGKPFGGVCLPKDLDSMVKICDEYGIPSDIFNVVKKVNERIGGEK